MILKLLTKIFSKKKYQKFNFLILHAVLKFMGYKNYGSYYETGEKFFLMKLKKHNIKTAIDIGANIGLYSKELLNIAQTKVKTDKFIIQINSHNYLLFPIIQKM